MYAQYKLNSINRSQVTRPAYNYKSNDRKENRDNDVMTCSELRQRVRELLQGRSKNSPKLVNTLPHQTDSHSNEFNGLSRMNDNRNSSKQAKKNSVLWRVYQYLDTHDPWLNKKGSDEHNPMWDDLINQLKSERKKIINKYKSPVKKVEEADKGRLNSLVAYQKNDHTNTNKYHPNAWDIDEQRRRDLMRLKRQAPKLIKKSTFQPI